MKCISCSLELKEEGRLCVIGNRVLRETFGLTGEKVKRGWKNLQNEDPRNLLQV